MCFDKYSENNKEYNSKSEVNKKLWGGNTWSAGYFISMVGKNGN